MNHKFVFFLAFTLLTCNILCLIIDGAWLGAEDLSLMQYLTGMSGSSLNWTAIVTLPIGFVTHGLPKMLFWDYSFLSGGLGIIRWLLMFISIGAIWALAQEFRLTITSIFGRR